MKKITIVLMLLITGNCFSQAPNWVWEKSAGGTLNDSGGAIATDAFGNIYVSGNFSSPIIVFGTDTLLNTGTTKSDFYLVKYNSAGIVLWAKSFGGAGDEYISSIKSDATGDLYLTGIFNSQSLVIGNDTLTNYGNINSNDIFVLKCNSAGNLIWTKTFGGSYDDTSSSITIDSQGNVYVTGNFDSQLIIFGSDTLTLGVPGNKYYMFLLKLDPSGSVIWEKHAGGYGINQGNSVCSDVSGNTYVTGSYSSTSIAFGNDTLSSIGNYHMFIAKYDAGGNTIWAKGVGEDYANQGTGGNSIVADASGSIYIVGYFSTSAIVFDSTTLINTDSANHNYDLFIVKYNATGGVVWARSAGGISFDEGNSIAIDASGIYITGGFQSSTIAFGSDTLMNTSIGNEMFIAKYDFAGNVVWVKSTIGNRSETGVSVAVDFSGLYVSGLFYSPVLNFGADSLVNTDNTGATADMFIAKLSSTTGISEINSNQQFVSIYPNPTTSQTTISFNEEQKNVSINITDVLGKLVYTTTAKETNKINITLNQPAGLYFVSVVCDGPAGSPTEKRQVMKLIKE